MMAHVLTERELKAFCLMKLWASRRINSSSVIASEFPLANSSGRIDLAILTTAGFTGIEIKSERDSLRRLDKQVEAFSRYFDRLIVLLAGRHAEIAIKPPENVELWKFVDDRLVRLPPQSINVQSESLVRLLPKRKRLILETHPTEARKIAARKAFLQEFRRRYQETSSAFWKLAEEDRAINVRTLDLLSPHRAFREANRAQQERKLQILSGWHKAQSDQSSSVS